MKAEDKTWFGDVSYERGSEPFMLLRWPAIVEHRAPQLPMSI